jgi:hypothetical protein
VRNRFGGCVGMVSNMGPPPAQPSLSIHQCAGFRTEENICFLDATREQSQLLNRCHGPQQRAIQMGVKLTRRADARRLGGPIKSGHDK